MLKLSVGKKGSNKNRTIQGEIKGPDALKEVGFFLAPCPVALRYCTYAMLAGADVPACEISLEFLTNTSLF